MRQPFQPESAGSVAAPTQAATDPLVTKGAAVYVSQPCGSCHGDHGEGTDAAPALIGIGQKYSPEQLTFLLHHLTPGMIQGGMPPVDLDDADMKALVAYLRSLKK